MNNNLKPQVEKGHYHRAKYDDLERFISYYYQISLVRSLETENLLEIGVGPLADIAGNLDHPFVALVGGHH